MSQNKLKISIALASCSLSIALFSGNEAWARNASSTAKLVPDNQIAQLFQPPDRAAPQQATGGASRGENELFIPPVSPAPMETTGAASRGDETEASSVGESVNQSITATTQGLETLRPVMPPTNYGQTVSGRPTFFLYVPEQALNGNKQVFFTLQGQENYYYQTRLDLPAAEGGIISFQLPEDAPELLEGEAYKWFFTLTDKGQRLQADTEGLTGWVERIQPTAQLGQQEYSPATLELALSYAKAGIWYDAVNTLVELKQAQSQDNTLVSYWETLLTEVGLEAIAFQPIVELPSTSTAISAN